MQVTSHIKLYQSRHPVRRNDTTLSGKCEVITLGATCVWDNCSEEGGLTKRPLQCNCRVSDQLASSVWCGKTQQLINALCGRSKIQSFNRSVEIHIYQQFNTDPSIKNVSRPGSQINPPTLWPVQSKPLSVVALGTGIWLGGYWLWGWSKAVWRSIADVRPRVKSSYVTLHRRLAPCLGNWCTL